MATLMIAPAHSSEKRTAISPYDPSFITLLRLSAWKSKKKKRLTMSKRFERVSTSDCRTSRQTDTIFAYILFFYAEFVPCRISPSATGPPLTHYFDDEKCRDRGVAPSLFTCSFSIPKKVLRRKTDKSPPSRYPRPVAVFKRPGTRYGKATLENKNASRRREVVKGGKKRKGHKKEKKKLSRMFIIKRLDWPSVCVGLSIVCHFKPQSRCHIIAASPDSPMYGKDEAPAAHHAMDGNREKCWMFGLYAHPKVLL